MIDRKNTRKYMHALIEKKDTESREGASRESGKLLERDVQFAPPPAATT